MNWSEFFHMGGYAPYVWSSYALGLVILVANAVGPALRHRRVKEEIRSRLRREGKL